jgi:hypothetical protein
MAGYIHDDVREIMEDAADPNNTNAPSTVGFTPEQLEAVNIMLQYSWNRGYKSACQDRDAE